MLKRVAIIMMALVMLGMMLLPALETVVQGMDEHYSGYYDKCDEDEPDLPELPDGIHCCSGLHDFEEWLCSICNEDGCDCYLEYCMRCEEPHENCDCEFVGIMPIQNCWWGCGVAMIFQGPQLCPIGRCGLNGRSYRCPSCNRQGGSLPACGCDTHTCSFSWRQTVNATCTTDGTQRDRCSCGAQRGNPRALPLARGHDMGEWFIENPATTTDNGNERRNCLHTAVSGFAACAHYETRTLYSVIYNNSINEFTFSVADGELVQGILSGENASPPTMNIFSDCGRRVWQGWDDDGTYITEPREINPIPMNDRSYSYDEDGNDLGHGYPDGSVRRHRVHYISTINHDGEYFTFARTSDSSQYVQFIEHTFDTVPVITGEFSTDGRRFFPGWVQDGENITEPMNIYLADMVDDFDFSNPEDRDKDRNRDEDGNIISHVRRHRVEYTLSIGHNRETFTWRQTNRVRLIQFIENSFNTVPAEVENLSTDGRRFFPGWTHNGRNITEAKAINPNALDGSNIRTHEVTFVLNNSGIEGRHNGGGDLVQNVEHTKNAVLPFVRDAYGHTFTGWDSDSNHINVREKRTIVAEYTPDPYYVIFLNYDETEITRIRTLFGETARAPSDPVKPMHNFSGWSEDDFTIRSESNLIVYPIFTIHCVNGNCDNEDNLCSDCGRCQDCCNCCAAGGCDNTELCDDCGRCQDCCNCCAVGGCDNTDLCDDCGRCQDCCNCCAVGGCDNTDLCKDCGRCQDCCDCGGIALLAADDEGARTVAIGTMPLGTPPMFSFMGRNIYLFAPLHIASWSIVNLLLTVLGAIFVIVKLLQKKKGDEMAEKPEEQGQHKKKWLLPASAFGAIAILLFIMSQDMTALIALLDTWTIAHMAIFIIQIICIKAYNKGPDEPEHQSAYKTIEV